MCSAQKDAKEKSLSNNRVVDTDTLGRQGRAMKSLISYQTKIYTFLTSNEERRWASVVALKNTVDISMLLTKGLHFMNFLQRCILKCFICLAETG